MPHGFFTIEQWKRPDPGSEPQWLLVRHLNSSHSLSDAIEQLEELGQPGFYRVVQTQRMIWAEKRDGKLHLRKWHAGSPEELSRSTAAFDRDGGRWPEPRRTEAKEKRGPKAK
jgi:hypothetical protein